MKLTIVLAASAFAAFAAGCTAETEDTVTSEDAILNGTSAATHPEAVLIDMYQGNFQVAVCSGSLIAPKVVLTAGHCVHGISGFRVTTPPTGASAISTSGETLDWDTDSEFVDPSMHDVGLIFLNTAINLSSYPRLSRTKLPEGTSVVNLGRVKNGIPRKELFVGPSIPVYDAKPYGFPFDYISKEIIESGDSGGPVELAGITPPVIVAVNSGGGGTQVLARVDLVESWITAKVNAHGGFSGSGGFVTLTTKPAGSK